MVNTEEFIKRLEKVLDYYNLNASSFADKIGVQRSSLSHLLSGRNKPSLDFIMKILEVFPEVDLYWILNGKGNFPMNSVQDEKENFIEHKISPTPIFEKQNIKEAIPNLFNTEEAKAPPSDVEKTKESIALEKVQNNIIPKRDSAIHKIVIFYKDGTFEDFSPS